MSGHGANYNYPPVGGAGPIWNDTGTSDLQVKSEHQFIDSCSYDSARQYQPMENPQMYSQMSHVPSPNQNMFPHMTPFDSQMIKSEVETPGGTFHSGYFNQLETSYENQSSQHYLESYNQGQGYPNYQMQSHLSPQGGHFDFSGFQAQPHMGHPDQSFNYYSNYPQTQQQFFQPSQGEFINSNCVQNQYDASQMPLPVHSSRIPRESSFERINFLPTDTSQGDIQFNECNSWDRAVPGPLSQPMADPIPTVLNFKLDDYFLSEISGKVILLEKEQCLRLRNIQFGRPVSYIYNPLVYAFLSHLDFLKKYCNTEKDILFLGINPGPFGMAQNGVPFGAVDIVANWLQVSGQVFKPWREHPKRIICGADCSRSEVSGSRFWKLFMAVCKTPENFFRHCFVHNFCPLTFMNETGKNLTPPDLDKTNRHEMHEVCDSALLELIRILKVKVVVGVGRYAETRAKNVLKKAKLDGVVRVECLSHPSPLNREAHKGWEELAFKQLENMGIMPYLTAPNSPVVSPVQSSICSDHQVLSSDSNFYLPYHN